MEDPHICDAFTPFAPIHIVHSLLILPITVRAGLAIYIVALTMYDIVILYGSSGLALTYRSGCITHRAVTARHLWSTALGPLRKCVVGGVILGRSQWFGLGWAYPEIYLCFLSTHTTTGLFHHQSIGCPGCDP